MLNFDSLRTLHPLRHGDKAQGVISQYLCVSLVDG
jgi:hypothetical protein